MRKVAGGVTAAKGFQAACCAAGIKYRGRTDMAMILSGVPCAVAGTFTSNKVKASSTARKPRRPWWSTRASRTPPPGRRA